MNAVPAHVKAIQEKFRPRMEALDARAAERKASELASEIDRAEIADHLTAEDALAILGDEIEKH